jgi:multidrug transporter EmrE-like cation transporter
MWFRLMIIAFLLNGLSPFGLRILTDLGLASQHTRSYLIFWYLSGLCFVLILYLRAFGRPTLNEVLVAAVLGLFSVCGQTFLGLALSRGLAGNVVYPVTLAGGLIIVVLSGVLVFKEQIGKAGIAGIALGIFSLALLSLG